MNPWHDIRPGSEAPKIVNAVIEIPAMSKTKFELDKECGLIRVDRVLFSAVHYPHNYGFIPQTYCDDGDPLDIFVVGEAQVYPLTMMRAKPIGVMRMIDQGKMDDKIIAVHADDPTYSAYNNIKELPQHILAQMKNFFENYKVLEGKEVSVEGFQEQREALQIIEEARDFYRREEKRLRS